MDPPEACPALDAAFDDIDSAILPTLSTLLDNLLDAAALAVPGLDSDRHAAELRRLSRQVADLSWRIEAIAPAEAQPPARLTMSA